MNGLRDKESIDAQKLAFLRRRDVITAKRKTFLKETWSQMAGVVVSVAVSVVAIVVDNVVARLDGSAMN